MPRRDYVMRIYLDVIALHNSDGTVQPIKFRTEDGGTSFIIDRVRDTRQAASLKAGGQGIRYTCDVNGHEIYLFDDSGFWFAEREQAEALLASEA